MGRGFRMCSGFGFQYVCCLLPETFSRWTWGDGTGPGWGGGLRVRSPLWAGLALPFPFSYLDPGPLWSLSQVKETELSVVIVFHVHQFDYDGYACGFPCAFLLGLCWAAWIFRFMSVVEFGDLLASVPLNICFCTAFFLFLLWDPNNWVLDLLILPHWPLRFFSCLFQIIFLFVVQIGYSLFICVQVHWLFLVIYSFCYWAHPLRFLFWLLYFSGLKCPLGSLYILFLCWDFLSFHWFQECIHSYFLECFCNSCF